MESGGRAPIRVFAHRGCSAHLPENTIAAFRQAIVDGADALELDVHCTTDGHFVVSHDGDGLRTARVNERICDLSLGAVKRWDVGAGFFAADGEVPFLGLGHTVPTLEEVFTEFPSTLLSVDLKPNNPDLVPPFLDLVSRVGAEPMVTVTSFHDRMIQRVRSLGFSGATTLTRREVAMLRLLPLAVSRPRIAGDAAQIPRRYGPISLDRTRFIRRCQRLGIRADYWVINEPTQALDLLSRGATGIMTDDPRQLVGALSQAAENRKPGRKTG